MSADTPPGLNGSHGLHGYMGDTLNAVRAHLKTYVLPLHDEDLDLLALWAAHTHLTGATYTTPRLCLSSPLPESGKTTVLDHFQRLCHAPINMASTGSPALFARMLNAGMRTLMIDEADRNLRPDKDGVEDVLAILNTGYKRGGTRPVLERNSSGGFDVVEMPTFAPLVLAGIAPDLPDDTLSRTLVVTMLPDTAGHCEESDWERIEADTVDLGARLAEAATRKFDQVREADPELPDGCIGRTREKWRPLARIAAVAGGDWPDRCRHLIERDIAERQQDKEEGLVHQAPQLLLLADIAAQWPEGLTFWPTEAIRQAMVTKEEGRWGKTDRFPKGLTVQRIGRYLGKGLGLRTHQQTTSGERMRGYLWSDVERVAARLGCLPSNRANPASRANRATCGVCGDPLDERLEARHPTGLHPNCEVPA